VASPAAQHLRSISEKCVASGWPPSVKNKSNNRSRFQSSSEFKSMSCGKLNQLHVLHIAAGVA
jgi:hypothetical protein